MTDNESYSPAMQAWLDQRDAEVREANRLAPVIGRLLLGVFITFAIYVLKVWLS